MLLLVHVEAFLRFSCLLFSYLKHNLVVSFWYPSFLQELCQMGSLAGLLSSGALRCAFGDGSNTPACSTSSNSAGSKSGGTLSCVQGLVLSLLAQVAGGMAYLHGTGIVHGDLHAGRILLCMQQGADAGEETSEEDQQAHEAVEAPFQANASGQLVAKISLAGRSHGLMLSACALMSVCAHHSSSYMWHACQRTIFEVKHWMSICHVINLSS